MRNLLITLAHQIGLRNDADSMWFVRQLEQELTKEYEKVFPKYSMANGDILPFDTEVDAGAETYVYYFVEPIGMAKILNTYADTDIPEVGVAGKPTTGKCVAISNFMAWSTQDARTASMAKRDFVRLKKTASKQGHVQQWNTLGWVGSTAHGVFGLLTHPNITHTFAPLNGGASSTLWENKTFEEIAADFATLINTPSNLTNDIESVDTVVVPSNKWRALQGRPVAAANGSNISIAGWIEATYPQVTFVADPFMQSENHADTEFAGKNICVAYTKDPDKASFVLPLDYTINSPQEVKLRIETYTESRCGGAKIPAPLSVHVLHSI